jgi:hypothetical protein
MTDEDLFSLVTSIDENDIEIIPSNEQMDFIPDYFAMDNRNIHTPSVPIQTINPTARLTREDSEVIFKKNGFSKFSILILKGI